MKSVWLVTLVQGLSWENGAHALKQLASVQYLGGALLFLVSSYGPLIAALHDQGSLIKSYSPRFWKIDKVGK